MSEFALGVHALLGLLSLAAVVLGGLQLAIARALGGPVLLLVAIVLIGGTGVALDSVLQIRVLLGLAGPVPETDPQSLLPRLFGIAAAGAMVAMFLHGGLERERDRRDRAERELQENQARAQDFAAASGQWFWETDAEHRYTWISERFEDHVEGRREWLYGQMRTEVGRPVDPDPEWERHLEDIAARRPFRDVTFHRVGIGGRSTWIRSSGVPFYDADGRFRGYRGSGSDITEMVLAQRAMEQFARMWASANANGAPTGAAQQLDADVVSPDLRELLGPTMRLTFDMGGWKPAAFRNKAVTTFLRGRYRTGSGQESEAPFLVRFPVDDGTVIFTSFHNAKQNDEDELKLLRFLVFAAVTAEAETLLTKTMVAGGFSPVKKNIHSHSSGSPSVTQVYRNKKAGRLQFAIGLPNDGARLKMTIVAPNGQIYEKQFESTFIVEVPNAPIGDWRYTVAAEDVPFPNFPFTVSIGEE